MKIYVKCETAKHYAQRDFGNRNYTQNQLIAGMKAIGLRFSSTYSLERNQITFMGIGGFTDFNSWEDVEKFLIDEYIQYEPDTEDVAEVYHFMKLPNTEFEKYCKKY